VKRRFEKWHGLGNDFVILEGTDLPTTDALARDLCDRRHGIGADGILLVDTHPAIPSMTVRNADGSRPEMCGNGLRCVAAYLANAGGQPPIRVSTDAGDRLCQVTPTDRATFDVTIEMGAARLTGEMLASHRGRTLRFFLVDVGNPHAVTFDPIDPHELETLAPEIALRPPHGTNVELCTQRPERISVVVWERGVGPTLACGTGACAVAAVACETGRAPFDAPLAIELPGGILHITISRDTRLIRMRGPAVRVFTGELDL